MGLLRSGILLGVHGTSIDIEIGVNLDGRDVYWVSMRSSE